MLSRAYSGRIYRRGRTALAALRTLIIRNDLKRWRQVALGGVPSWDERNRLIAEFIPMNSSVLDLGAGAQLLKSYLKPGCTYQACDVVSNLPDVIYCDFNAKAYPKLPRVYDVVVCSGILEYMRSPFSFLSEIRTYGGRIILSYNPLIEATSKVRRLAVGWVNHFTEDELANLFTDSNFKATIIHCSRLGEVIYELVPIQ